MRLSSMVCLLRSLCAEMNHNLYKLRVRRVRAGGGERVRKIRGLVVLCYVNICVCIYICDVKTGGT